MFPSSGLFSAIRCPVSKRGVCERPHCPYKHATEVRDSLGASYKSSIIDADRAGLQNGYPSFETTNVCLQELERINKEIKTVTHEVEQEQRRLSHYQTVKADCRSTASDFEFSESEIAVKHVDKGSNAQSSCIDFTKTSSRAKKYVVDNSKPRTDLEYDPLSNFSADLRSYSSSGREQKVKNGQCLKKEREAVSSDQNKPAALAQLSQTPPPEPLDESNEDGILVIDIPPSPDKKRGRTLKLDDSLAGKSGIKKECNRSKAVVQYSSALSKNKGSENKPADGGVIDLTGCLDDVGSECQKIACQTAETEVENNIEPESLPAPSDQQDQSWNNLVGTEEKKPQLELSQCDLSCSVEKMNPLEPHQFPSGNSLFNETQAANSGLSCRKKTKDAQSADLQAQNRVHKIPVPEPTSGTKQSEICLPSSVYSHLTNEDQAFSSEIAEQLLNKGCDEKVIVISSSEEEEEINYSDVELSDSDPTEECYRIFMEANNEDKGNEKQPTLSVETMDVQRPELNIMPPALLGKRRVAHEVKHTEQPAAKSKPQPQVLVPLRGPEPSGFGTQSSTISKIHQVQQRASMLTASVKGGQAFSSTSQKKPETQTTACPPIQISASTQPTHVHHAYMNYLSLGTAVIDVGNNLHLILPEGTFPLPVTSSSSPVTSVLTPVSQGHTNNLTVKPTCTAAVTHVQRYRTMAPVLIPAPTRKPLYTSALAHSSSASSIASQPAVKPLPTKRKLKQQSEAAKVPHDVRQRYVNMFTEEFLKTSASVNDAFEKAVAEERGVYNRSANKLKYTSIAVNLLKRLKNQSATSSKDEENVNCQKLKGSIPIDLKKLKGNDDVALYESLKDYILTEERLIESNYPVRHPEKPGSAALFSDNKKSSTDPLKRICCRCGATYSVSQIGKHIRKEECNYHYGKGVTKRVPGGVETRYSCCEGVIGAPGCQVFKLHVHDTRSLDGFVSTIPRHLSDKSCPGVYSLNCEKCYTVHGLELSRVTVVNSRLQVVYDTFVRPDSEVIDYNTRFSGISEEDVKGNNTSIQEVQETLLSFIYADTILVGHSLETDLCALKLLHGMVVDTSVVFPHRLGHPHKLTLNNLTAEYLRRIIQESVCGHDTAEDATACMELMLWKLKEDGKLKK